MENVTCKICGKNFKYISNSHLKTHNMTCQEYKIKFNETSLITPSLRIVRGNKTRGKSYEEIHGLVAGKNLRQIRSTKTQELMKDPKERNKRKISGVKKDNPIYECWKTKISLAQTKEVQDKRRLTLISNLKNNPDFFNNKKKHMSKSSKEASDFFINFCITNKISFEEVIFSGNPYVEGNYEFGRLIWYPDCQKYIYTLYDFVQFKNSRNNIIQIIEYQGYFHYTRAQVIEDPDSPYLPFISEKNGLSKKQSYLKDCTKLNFALTNLCENVYEVWWNDKKLVRYLGER